MNLNKVIIVGRLTQDPEVRTLPSGQNVANFGMATNRFWTNNAGEKQESTEFHNIVLFGKLADIANSYLNKGQLALIEGRLQTRSWEDQSGIRKYKTEVIADSMQLGPRSANSGSGQNSSQNYGPKTTTDTIPSDSSDEKQSKDDIPVIDVDNENKSSKENEDNVDVKDIPF